MQTSKIFSFLKYWLPLAVVITLLSGLAYIVVQQDLRQSANDPQIQMAEDAAAALASGGQPQALVSGTKVDLAKSLAPYLLVFDEAGRPVASSAELEGKTPIPPSGVFADTKKRGESRFTWQPKPGVRSAAVVAYYSKGANSGFVLAGRSLREVENRERDIEILAALVWIVSLVASLAVTAFLATIASRLPQ